MCLPKSPADFSRLEATQAFATDRTTPGEMFWQSTPKSTARRVGNWEESVVIDWGGRKRSDGVRRHPTGSTARPPGTADAPTPQHSQGRRCPTEPEPSAEPSR